jgi:hypothetical protein
MFFVERLKKMPAIFFPGGGTTAIHVTGVSECIVASSYNGENGKAYLPASENIKFKKMIKFMMASAGFPKKFIKIPACVGYLAGLSLMSKEKKHGRESGLHLAKIMTDILSKDLFADCEKTKIELNYHELGFNGGENVWIGIKEAMKKAYPNRFVEMNF